MINKKRVEDLTNSLEKHRSFLEDYVGISLEEFISDEKQLEFDAILRNLQIMIQAAIDIGKHILASRNEKMPQELKEIFLVLAKRGILTEDLAERLARATGLRNILVHYYTDVDPKKIHEIMQTDLGDFDRFVLAINEYLKKEENVSL